MIVVSRTATAKRRLPSDAASPSLSVDWTTGSKRVVVQAAMRLQHRGRHALTFFFVLPIVLQSGWQSGRRACNRSGSDRGAVERAHALMRALSSEAVVAGTAPKKVRVPAQVRSSTLSCHPHDSSAHCICALRRPHRGTSRGMRWSRPFRLQKSSGITRPIL